MTNDLPRDDSLVELALGPYVLTAATSFGPRVLSLRHRDGPNLFARHQSALEHPDSGVYHTRGGHRLWAAPEVPLITYAPDDHECEVKAGTDQLTITAPVDSAGFTKEIRVGWDGQRLVVDHRLVNAGRQPISVAPWGVTQFRLGGDALVPITGTAPNQFQADSSIVLWPYTDLADPRLSWMGRAVGLHAAAGPRLKIGTGPRPGRLGYLIDGFLFTKTVAAAGDGAYPDRQAVGQVFVADTFCEVETVGAITNLEQGASVSHQEVWEIEPCDDLATAYRLLVEQPPV